MRTDRIERSSRPFLARGSRTQRCPDCRVSVQHCLCAVRPVPRAGGRSAFCLLMHEAEPMRPSNTGWLVADVVADTTAFSWARQSADPRMIRLLDDPERQPYVVFPERSVHPDRVVRTVEPPPAGRRPLFVLLDATWAEAHKMFHRSPYLDRFPVLAIDGASALAAASSATSSPSASAAAPGPVRARLRRTKCEAHLCTAEVAAACLRLADEPDTAAVLDTWLDTFVALSMRLRGQG